MAYTSNKQLINLEAKATPVDADVIVIGDTADSDRAKKTTWANLKTVLSSFFATIASPTFTGTVTTPAIIVSDETASRIASIDASKNIKSLATATYPSLAELIHLKDVSSAIQTQLNAKAPSASPTFTTKITGSFLTASRILITNASKEIISAPVATYPSLAELIHLKGVSSAIQTQLDALTVPIYKNGDDVKNAADASTTQNIAHGLGTTPKKVKITALSFGSTGSLAAMISITAYNGTTQSSISTHTSGAGVTTVNTFTLNTSTTNTNTQIGVVTFDGTNIIITWTKTGSPTGDYKLLWEAEI